MTLDMRIYTIVGLDTTIKCPLFNNGACDMQGTKIVIKPCHEQYYKNDIRKKINT